MTRRSLGFPLWSCLLLSILLSPARARGDDGLPSEPVFQARLTDGTSQNVRLQRLDAQGKLTFRPEAANAASRVLSLDQVVVLQRDGVSPPYPPEGPGLLFPEGDRLRAMLGPVEDQKLRVQSPCLGPMEVNLSSVLGLIFATPTELDPRLALLGAMRAEPGGKEVLWLVNGDRQEGGFLGLSAEAIEFQGPGGLTTVPRKGARALAFDPKLVEYPRPRGTYVELTLIDGSRFGLAGTRYDQGAFEGVARFGPSLRIPVSEVARVTVRAPTIAYLSERAEDGVKYTPYLGNPRPYRRDSAVDGQPLTLGGLSFDRGLGMQSRTLLAYKLDTSARRFQATIGLDDRAGPLGNVLFRVRVDDREVYVSPPMTSGEKPRELDLNIQGGRFLILEADFAERGDVRDLADWADARVIRDPATGPR